MGATWPSTICDISIGGRGHCFWAQGLHCTPTGDEVMTGRSCTLVTQRDRQMVAVCHLLGRMEASPAALPRSMTTRRSTQPFSCRGMSPPIYLAYRAGGKGLLVILVVRITPLFSALRCSLTMVKDYNNVNVCLVG